MLRELHKLAAEHPELQGHLQPLLQKYGGATWDFPNSTNHYDIEALVAKHVKGFVPGSLQFGKMEAYPHSTNATVACTFSCQGSRGPVRGEVRVQLTRVGSTLTTDVVVVPS